jgi:hypothetical protein
MFLSHNEDRKGGVLKIEYLRKEPAVLAENFRML